MSIATRAGLGTRGWGSRRGLRLCCRRARGAGAGPSGRGPPIGQVQARCDRPHLSFASAATLQLVQRQKDAELARLILEESGYTAALQAERSAESAGRLHHTRTVTGIDPTASVLAVAKAHQRSDPAISPPKLTYLHTAIEDLPVPPESTPDSSDPSSGETGTRKKADILTLFEVLEHIDHPSSFLRSCIPHLAPGGWLIGSTIARSPLSFLTTKLIAEAPVVGVVPPGTHDWNKYINPEELARWFEKRNHSEKGSEAGRDERWGEMKTQGVIYLPGLGWKMTDGTEGWGNYFFGVQRLE